MTIQEILEQELETLRLDIIERQRQSGQQTTGKTARSLRVETDETHGTLYGASYIGTLERGRQGGKVPQGFRHIIAQWAKDKGLSFGSESELKRFAYFVSKHIAESGTQLYRRGGRTDILTEPIERFTKRMNEQLAEFCKQEIINKIFEK